MNRVWMDRFIDTIEWIAAAFVGIVALNIFLAVILTTTRRKDAHAALVIPLTLAVVHFAGIPISGASVNPARALAPALVGGDLTSLWIYLTAPFVGAAVPELREAIARAATSKQP